MAFGITRTAAIAFALLCLGFPPTAGADSGFDCVRAFIAKRVAHLQGIQFETVDIKEGEHGGSLIEIQERDPESFRLPPKIARNSPERRPTDLIAAIADSKIARFFGFERLPSGHYLIPDKQELEGAIRAFNSLPGVEGTDQVIRVRFYEPPSSTNPRDYLVALADDGAFPIAQKGHYFIHDITVHAGGAAFLPESFLRAARLQTSELLSFESWLKSAAPDVYRGVDFQKIFELEAERIDFAQGDLLEALRNSTEGPKEPLWNAINRFTGWGKPPEAFMRELFERYPGMFPNRGQLDGAFARFLHDKPPASAAPFPTAEELSHEALQERIRFIAEKLKR